MILPHHGQWPRIHESVFVAPSADIIGEVSIGKDSSVWFQVVIRGDVNYIRIGERTNIQDTSTLHVTRKTFALQLGNEVTIGHRVLLHGCTIADRVLVGMGSIIMDGVEIGEECVIGAGTLITEGKKIPPRSLVLGSPGKIIRPLREEELQWLPQSAANYTREAREFQSITGGLSKPGQPRKEYE